MKAKKFMVTLLASSFLLAACGSGGTSDSGDASGDTSGGTEAGSSDVFSYVYSTDIDNLDYTVSQRTTNNEQYTNFVDGLFENDKYGNLVPAMAESWEVSDDGLTYTYHIRQGVQWVDNEGNEYGQEVTANDWVTGLQHAVDEQSETLYIVANSIAGLADYVNGKTDDFSTVGIKAVDDYTLEYTLVQPESFWNSKTTYGILYPVNADFLKSKGDSFGTPEPDGILYNGPYLLTNNTAKSVIEFEANESYWDADNVHIKEVKQTYYDGKDPDGLFRSFANGDYTQARVFPNSAGYKDVTADYADSILWSETSGSTFNMTFNFSRGSYEATSKTTDAEKESTKKAVLNRDFRLAIEFAFDRVSYRAQSVGDEGAEKAIRNTWIPPEFLTIEGKPYGDSVAEKTKALDGDAFGDVDFSEGQDGYYNPDKAKTYIDKAKEALEADGVEFPIHLDLPVDGASDINVSMMKSLKSTIEDALGTDNVVIDIQLLSNDKYLAATYQAATGAASDYDISTASGWGPDFVDPSTYLNVYDSRNGDMLHTLGLEGTDTVQGDDPSADAKKALNLEEYDALLDKANAITDDVNARYTAYADAEAWLLNSAIQIPIYASGGNPSVNKVVPFTGSYSWAGITSFPGGNGPGRLKYVEMQDKAVTTDEYNQAKEQWEKEKEASNKKAAETGGVLSE